MTRPLLKQDGQWREVEWSDALEYVRHALTHVRSEYGAEAIGALTSPNSTLEELFLLGRLLRGVGSDNIDFRLRQSDFSGDRAEKGVPWLGLPIAELGTLDRVLLIGSFLRKDQPLLSTRLRHATNRRAQLSVLNAVDDDLLMRIAQRLIVRPSDWVTALAEIAAAMAGDSASAKAGVEPSATAKAIAQSLLSGERKAILLGNAAMQHPQAAQLRAWAQAIARASGARVGVLTEGANAVGAHVVGARPSASGLNARQMLEQPRQAYLLWNLEPEYDTADPTSTANALAAAKTVIAFSPYRNGALEYADVILPITPFSETAGTFVSGEGRAQTFNGAVRPLGDARPGWKVLRVLGNLLEIDGFDYETAEAVRADALPSDLAARLSNEISLEPVLGKADGAKLERLADVPIYASDAIARRAPSLQATADARPPLARLNRRTADSIGVSAGMKLQLRQGQGSAVLDCQIDERVADGVVRVAAAHLSTARLGPMLGPIAAEPA